MSGPPKTLYLMGGTLTNGFQPMQDGGTAPTDAFFATGTGWISAANANATMANMVPNTVVARTVFSTTVVPASLLTGATTNAFRSPTAYTGTFDNANWTLQAVLQPTVAQPSTLRLRWRVYASVNADGTASRELTGAVQLSNGVAPTTLSTNYTYTATWAPAATITLNNEYLFFAIAQEMVTLSGTGNTRATQFRQNSTSAVTTPNFTLAQQGSVQLSGVGSLAAVPSNLPPPQLATVLLSGADSLSAQGSNLASGAISVRSVGYLAQGALGLKPSSSSLTGMETFPAPLALRLTQGATSLAGYERPTAAPIGSKISSIAVRGTEAQVLFPVRQGGGSVFVSLMGTAFVVPNAQSIKQASSSLAGRQAEIPSGGVIRSTLVIVGGRESQLPTGVRALMSGAVRVRGVEGFSSLSRAILSSGIRLSGREIVNYSTARPQVLGTVVINGRTYQFAPSTLIAVKGQLVVVGALVASSLRVDPTSSSGSLSVIRVRALP